MSRRISWRDPLLWLASLAIGTFAVEGMFWVRHRVNAMVQHADQKITQDTRVADALWELVAISRARVPSPAETARADAEFDRDLDAVVRASSHHGGTP